MLISSPLKQGLIDDKNSEPSGTKTALLRHCRLQRPCRQSFRLSINTCFAMLTGSGILDLEILQHGIPRVDENARLRVIPPHKDLHDVVEASITHPALSKSQLTCATELWIS